MAVSRGSVELTVLPMPENAFQPFARRPSVQSGISSIENTTTQKIVTQHDASTTTSLQPLQRVDSAATVVTSKTQTGFVIVSVTLITGISTLLNGLTTVALPTIAAELKIPHGLLLWPTSIQALTSGCTLLISGSIADALGARFMYLVGCVLQGSFILGCGLARTSTEIILFRGLSGIALSFCLPSAVSIITSTLVGKTRNMGFACMGGGQPIGFSIGLALGGVLTDSIGWRWGFYISAMLNVVVLVVAIWALPKSIDNPMAGDATKGTWASKLEQLRTEIDWVGALLASTSLAMLSFVFAAITGTTKEIARPYSIALLITAIALVPAFIFWVGRQERLGRPAIIPNSLWRNKTFTTICLAVFLTWGSFNALETVLTFYFQKVQNLSATQTSLRFLPAPISGAISNIAMGLIVHRVSANYLTVGGCMMSSIAPLIMVFATPTSSYWTSGFLANIFNPNGADSLFTVSNLLITSVFPSKTQALAGGVFNTVSQIGKSFGLALVAAIAASVTAKSQIEDKQSPEALLEGYRATFWYCFATVVVTVIICFWGLRRIGTVGHKRD
ncbi:Hypothetical protein R9X50_00719500 [Acrodontium crateriforme]|uniref:Major facilitator superfamily (MFS) profile domain-containing protein n=1 Tax=Acrodontium crateriforme TaxID=150365 RepID=A0AAQ3RC23_9PEZI|nr:Hypothetical protein R9X50_00719500 [Acrodontium crateriforme]